MKILDKDFFNSIDQSVIDSIIEKGHIRKELLNLEYSEFLKFYLILTYEINKVSSVPLDVLYTSRYYWLKLFYRFYSLNLGEDSGIEQQIGRLVEEMSSKLINYDWSLLEKISKKIENINV